MSSIQSAARGSKRASEAPVPPTAAARRPRSFARALSAALSLFIGVSGLQAARVVATANPAGASQAGFTAYVVDDVVSGVLPALLKLVDDYGIAKVLNATVVEITAGEVVVTLDGVRKGFPADMVVLAMGMNQENGLVQELKAKVKEVLVVGDAVRPRQALQATREGFVAGLNV